MQNLQANADPTHCKSELPNHIFSEAKDTHKAEVTDQNTANRAGTQSSLCCEEHKHTVSFSS